MAGVFSKDKNKSIEFGKSLGLDKHRCYHNYKEMAAIESAKTDGVEPVSCFLSFLEHGKSTFDP